MTKIILAYCQENADLAAAFDQPLSRLGIPFEHVVCSDQNPETFSATVRSAQEPVLLFVTDNFLRCKGCMSTALDLVQTLNRQHRLVCVVADGKGLNGERVETHIDRMVNAIQYTNYWQSIYLDLSSRQSQIPQEERGQFDADLAIIRDISNEVFDMISALRESNRYTWEQMTVNDFQIFFIEFGLREWHEQYRLLNKPIAPPVEEKPAAAPQVSGPLAPAPAIGEPLVWPDEPPAAAPENAGSPAFEHIDAMLDEPEPPTLSHLPEEEPAVVPPSAHDDDDIRQTIRDAWFWLENGHAERGLQVFQLAMEEHPNNPELRKHYEQAMSQFVQTPDPEQQETHSTAPSPDSPNLPDVSEARSFEQIGDEAFEKGDFLFAKFCWDRVTELAPNYPGIYRKLGLMTSQYLRDYRETAMHYLDKALEQNTEDIEVRERLASLLNNAVVKEVTELPVVDNSPEIEPTLPDSAPVVEETPRATAPTKTEEDVDINPESSSVAIQGPKPLTVLITGATSGIGKATAFLFAQNGHRLILTGRRPDKLQQFAAELQQTFHSAVLPLCFDVRDRQAVNQHLGNLPGEWREIDVLLNNAGLAKGLAPIQEGDIDHWETMIDTNVKGMLYVTRCIAPGMVERRKGHIINICSSAGKEVYPKGNVYCATKFAVEALTKGMRLDLHAYNIRVSQVSPGHVEETEFALTRFDGDREKAKIYEDFQPLKASDVAEVIYFMATRPAHVNIQDVFMFGTQQASSTVIDRSGRG